MRKPRDFDGELKALGDKARDLKNRKVLGLGELVIATRADALSADELAGALIAGRLPCAQIADDRRNGGGSG
jgi:DNA-binding protein H-NS